MITKFVIKITIKINGILNKNTGFYLNYKASNQDKKLCLTADFKMVIVNQLGRPTTVPEKLSLGLFGNNK